MRILTAVMVAVLSTAPTLAQMPHINMLPEDKSKTDEERDQDKANQKAYKDSLSKIPDAKTSSDPWGAVRSDAPKAAAHPAKPKTKTGSTANTKAAR